MATPMVDEQDVEVLCESWAEIAPLIAELRRRTGLTQTQAMLLYTCSVLASDEGDERDDWQPA
jgi:hypothetical protein